jgi:hypothetical protein
LFCGSCGNKVETHQQLPTPAVAPQVAAPEYVAPAPKPPRKKMGKSAKRILFSGIAGIASIVVASMAISAVDYNNHIHPDYNSGVRYKIADYVDMAALTDLLGDNCAEVKPLYATINQYGTLNKRVSYMRGVASADSRVAKARLDGNTWYQAWTPPTFSDGMFYTSVSSTLRTSIESEIAKVEKIKDAEASDFFGYWADEIESEAVKACRINSINSKYAALESEYTSAKDAAQANADSAPWYPRGFDEWSDDSNIAWRWAPSGYYCDFGDRCWRVEVISRMGCPISLYVELNVLDYSDSVIDWTNDTVSGLAAGDKAKLELSTFNDNASSGRITKISCY